MSTDGAPPRTRERNQTPREDHRHGRRGFGNDFKLSRRCEFRVAKTASTQPGNRTRGDLQAVNWAFDSFKGKTVDMCWRGISVPKGWQYSSSSFIDMFEFLSSLSQNKEQKDNRKHLAWDMVGQIKPSLRDDNWVIYLYMCVSQNLKTTTRLRWSGKLNL